MAAPNYSANPAQTQTQTQTPTQTPQSNTPTDMSASFLAGVQNIQSGQNQITEESTDPTQFPADEKAQEAAAIAQGNITKSNTDIDYTTAEHQIKEQQATGANSIARGLDMIQNSPAAISSRVNEYTTSVANFNQQITDSISSLAVEYSNALASNDLNTANQIQTLRTNYMNMQQTNMQNSLNMFTGEWNAYATTMAAQQDQANVATTNALNQVNAITEAHVGQGWASLSPTEVQTMTAAAQTLGLPLSTYQAYIDNPNNQSTKATSLSEASANMDAQFNISGVQGKDGKVSPTTYLNLQREWIGSGATGATIAAFNDRFSVYADPSHLADYGIKTTSGTAQPSVTVAQGMQQLTTSLQQYASNGYTKTDVENAWMAGQKKATTVIPGPVQKIIDGLDYSSSQ
jgi:hypothetical protein